jgi:thiamine biosynthesis lipoprotein
MKNNIKKYRQAAGWCVLICLVLLVVYAVIQKGRQDRKNIEYTKTGFSMGTVISITLYGENGEASADNIMDTIDSLENNDISWRKDTSELYGINNGYTAGKEMQISQKLASYIITANDISSHGDNLLDITIRPLASLWGIEDGNTVVPSQSDIDTALEKVDCGAVHIYKNGIKINQSEDNSTNNLTGNDSEYTISIDNPDMIIDLGSIGKGIACDSVAEYLAGTDITGGIVSVGGSILCYGSKPDGSLYKVGIRDPRDENGGMLGVVNISAENKPVYVSTSGDYEKYFIADGIRYHHILNPKTGYPADTGLISATVVCDNGLLSDALSTLCILLGKDKALELVDYYNGEAILVDQDRQVYVTEGISSSFVLQNAEYTWNGR